MRETVITVIYIFDQTNIYKVERLVAWHPGFYSELKLYDVDDTLKMSAPDLRSSKSAGRAIVFKENHPMFNLRILAQLRDTAHSELSRSLSVFIRDYLHKIIEL